jgi:hypothetical protein
MIENQFEGMDICSPLRIWVILFPEGRSPMSRRQTYSMIQDILAAILFGASAPIAGKDLLMKGIQEALGSFSNSARTDNL